MTPSFLLVPGDRPSAPPQVPVQPGRFPRVPIPRRGLGRAHICKNTEKSPHICRLRRVGIRKTTPRKDFRPCGGRVLRSQSPTSARRSPPIRSPNAIPTRPNSTIVHSKLDSDVWSSTNETSIVKFRRVEVRICDDERRPPQSRIGFRAGNLEFVRGVIAFCEALAANLSCGSHRLTARVRPRFRCVECRTGRDSATTERTRKISTPSGLEGVTLSPIVK